MVGGGESEYIYIDSLVDVEQKTQRVAMHFNASCVLRAISRLYHFVITS